MSENKRWQPERGTTPLLQSAERERKKEREKVRATTSESGSQQISRSVQWPPTTRPVAAVKAVGLRVTAAAAYQWHESREKERKKVRLRCGISLLCDHQPGALVSSSGGGSVLALTSPLATTVADHHHRHHHHQHRITNLFSSLSGNCCSSILNLNKLKLAGGIGVLQTAHSSQLLQ